MDNHDRELVKTLFNAVRIYSSSYAEYREKFKEEKKNKDNWRAFSFVALALALAALFLFSPVRGNCDSLYFDVGAGYKLQEASIYGYDNDSPTAFLAVGYHWSGPDVRLELAHDSNWLSGPPFNDEWEYHKTEIRVTKRFTLWER